METIHDVLRHLINVSHFRSDAERNKALAIVNDSDPERASEKTETATSEISADELAAFRAWQESQKPNANSETGGA